MAVPSTSNSRGGGIDYIHIFTQNMLLKIRTGYTQIDIDSLPLNYGTNLDNKIGVVNGNLGDAKYSALSPAYLLDGSAVVGDGAFVPIHNPPGGGTADTKEREPAAVTHIFASKQMRERSLPGTQYGGLVAYSYPPYV